MRDKLTKSCCLRADRGNLLETGEMIKMLKMLITPPPKKCLKLGKC